MNEAREIRLRLLELVGRDGSVTAWNVLQTVLNLERFVMDAGSPDGDTPVHLSVNVNGADLADIEALADSDAPSKDLAGTA